MNGWKELDGIIATRILHNPLGSFKYSKNPTVSEIGICLEILNHMAINRFGEVSICVRFDPKRLGVIGDATVDPLLDIWNGPKRKEWVQHHIQGRRDKVPLCSYCDFWGGADVDLMICKFVDLMIRGLGKMEKIERTNQRINNRINEERMEEDVLIEGKTDRWEKCYLCGGAEFNRMSGSVRDNAELEVFECTSCGLVFLSSFDHIRDPMCRGSCRLK